MATAFVAYPGLVSTGLQKPLSQSYPPRYVSYAGRRAVPYKKRGAVGLKTDDSVAPPAVEMADADKGMSSSSTVSRISSWIWSALFGDSGINQNEDAPEPIDTARLNAKGKSVVGLVKGLYTTGVLSTEDLESATDVILSNPYFQQTPSETNAGPSDSEEL